MHPPYLAINLDSSHRSVAAPGDNRSPMGKIGQTTLAPQDHSIQAAL